MSLRYLIHTEQDLILGKRNASPATRARQLDFRIQRFRLRLKLKQFCRPDLLLRMS